MYGNIEINNKSIIILYLIFCIVFINQFNNYYYYEFCSFFVVLDFLDLLRDFYGLSYGFLFLFYNLV
jgi:hypothetical protein